MSLILLRYMEHDLLTLLRQSVYQIVDGYEDCIDSDVLKRDPAFKAACDRLLSESHLTSQPTLSGLENTVTIAELSSFFSNQFRLFLHMAAYWLVTRLREALVQTRNVYE